MATATSNAVIQFPTPSGSWTANEVGLYDGSGGSANLLWTKAVTIGTIASGDDVEIASGSAVFTLSVTSSTEITEAGAQDCLEGLISGTTYVGLLNSGTEISGNGYARVAVAAAAWTIA